jgi:hypothetical protein
MLISSLAARLRFFLIALTCCAVSLNISCAQAASQSRALWVWDASVITQSTPRDSLLNFCKAHGISTIYLHLGDFLGEKKRAEGDPKHVTAGALSTFLETAHAKNLRVEALDGDPSFSRAAQHEAGLNRLRAALKYNHEATTASRRLDGFQWDVEPYVLAEFKNETTHDAVLTEYLDFVKSSRDLVLAEKPSTPFALGFAVPFWMDTDKQSILWNGEKRPATFHVLELLSQTPNAYITIMAYRDKADGTISAVRDEVEYAAKNTPIVKIRVGQETGAVKNDPTSITFYEEGEGALEDALAKINDAYATSPVYGGVDIHHWVSYEDLIKRLPRVATAPSEVELVVTAPQEGEAGDAKINVAGRAPAGSIVQLSVKPDGDIWYEGARATVGANGVWTASARIGNEKTPAGRGFTLRVQLLSAEGGVLAEKLVRVSRR